MGAGDSDDGQPSVRPFLVLSDRHLRLDEGLDALRYAREEKLRLCLQLESVTDRGGGRRPPRQLILSQTRALPTGSRVCLMLLSMTSIRQGPRAVEARPAVIYSGQMCVCSPRRPQYHPDPNLPDRQQGMEGREGGQRSFGPCEIYIRVPRRGASGPSHPDGSHRASPARRPKYRPMASRDVHPSYMRPCTTSLRDWSTADRDSVLQAALLESPH